MLVALRRLQAKWVLAVRIWRLHVEHASMYIAQEAQKHQPPRKTKSVNPRKPENPEDLKTKDMKRSEMQKPLETVNCTLLDGSAYLASRLVEQVGIVEIFLSLQ